MAITNTLNTRIALKYDLLTNWNASSLILKKGEIAIAEIPSQNNLVNDSAHTPENAPPAILMKVGDGDHRFSELPWVQAVAGDVYAWAKKANAPTLGELTNIDADLKAEVDKILGQHGEILDTDTYYKVETGNDKIGSKHHFKLSAYKKDGTADTSKDIVINWSDLDTWMAAEKSRVQPWIDGAIEAIVPNEAQGEGKFVSAVDQANGKITVTRSNLVAADITDTIPQAKVAGLETIQSDVNNIKTTLSDHTNGTISAENKLMTATAVQTVVDNAIEASDAKLTVNQGTGNYVTSVTRDSNGVIQVTRDTLTSAKIGDWKTEVTDKLALKADAADLFYSDDTKPTATNYIVRKSDIEGLAHGLHFRGEVATNPTEWADPSNNDNVEYVAGDIVILANSTKEFVFNGTTWLELGDEGLYATKETLNEVANRVTTLETNHPKDVQTLRGEIATAKDEAIAAAQTNAESHVETVLLDLTHTTSGDGKFVTAVTQANGKVTVTKGTIAESDLPAISQDKVTNLKTDLKAITDKLALTDGEVTADNLIATKDTVTAAVEAGVTGLNTQLHRIAKSGDVDDLVQQDNHILLLDCGNSQVDE